MTEINCIIAAEHWTKDGKDEIDYLRAIQFAMIDKDEEGNEYISLQGDEEGNFDTRLTPKAARWLANELNNMAQALEEGE